MPYLYRQYYNGDTNIITDIDGMIKEFRNLSNNDDYKFISVIKDNKLIGFCSVFIIHDIVEKQRPIITISNLRIHPDYRGRGIGKQILKFVEDLGRSINTDFIFFNCEKENTKARKFYLDNGYKEDFGFHKYLD